MMHTFCIIRHNSKFYRSSTQNNNLGIVAARDETSSIETTSRFTMTSSDPAPTQQGEEETSQCHSLPCNIDFNGRAPVSVYFSTHLVTSESSKDAEKNETTNRVFGSQLRGRQLLASEPYQHHSNTELQGRLLEIDSCKGNSDEGKVRVVGKFNSIYEWKHECEPSLLQNPTYENSRVLASFQWHDVAHAVRRADCFVAFATTCCLIS